MDDGINVGVFLKESFQFFRVAQVETLEEGPHARDLPDAVEGAFLRVGEVVDDHHFKALVDQLYGRM